MEDPRDEPGDAAGDVRFYADGARGDQNPRSRIPEPAGPASSTYTPSQPSSLPPWQPSAQRHEPPASQQPAGRWDPIVVDLPTSDVEPVPPTGHYRADTEFDGWSTRDAAMRMASVRGYKHRYYGRPRQDDAKARVHGASGTVVFAVADGVSSAEQAELGAVIACNASVSVVLGMLDANRPVEWEEVIAYCASRLITKASSALGGVEPESAQVEKLFATTLVVGIARPVDGGLGISLCRVGDSGAWVLETAEDQRRYHPVFGSKTGSDAVVVSNAVRPLPRVPEPLEQRAFKLAPGAVLLVGTDGFGDPLGDGDGQVGALFAEHLTAPPRPLGFAHLLDFSRETFDDDRTLLGLWPLEPRGRT